MTTVTRIGSLAALALGGVIAQQAPAFADNVVARWIQLAPGSSTTPSIQNGAWVWGDKPTSTTPTILARAVISGGSCPAVTLDHGATTVTMLKRFDASTLTGLDITFSKFSDYPSSFVSHTSAYTYGSGVAAATTAWTECEGVVPAGHTIATVGGVDLKLPIASPKRILVFGDSGCRLNSAAPSSAAANSVLSTAASVTGAQQNCHDPNAFPFQFLANYEALYTPDLIVQVGDYFYRDSNCTSGGVETATGCTNPSSANYMPWGDTFDSWNADFFLPAQTLLATAPWVMIRGNHESCGRGARGWFAFLEPTPYNATLLRCTKNAGNATVSGTTPVYTGDFRPTYVVPAGQVNFLAHDSSFANDSAVDANMAKNYSLDMTALLAALPANSLNIYTTHKPTYGLVAPTPTNGGDFTEQYAFSGNASTNSAFAGGTVPSKIALFLSGHIHQFQYVNFTDTTHYAPQLIVGVGGDNLDPTANPDGTTLTYAFQNQPFVVHNNSNINSTTTTNSRAYTQAEFGFAVLDATATGFVANVYNIGSAAAGRCTITLSPRNISCWQ